MDVAANPYDQFTPAPPPPPAGATPGGGNPYDQFTQSPAATQPAPDLAKANSALSYHIGSTMKPALQTVEDMGTVYGPIEALANAGTGLLFGFPLKVGAAISGLAQKYLLGMDVDPKALSDTISQMGTYMPKTAAGQRLTGNLMLPFQAAAEAGQGAGQFVARHGADVGLSTGESSYAGAFTDEAVNFIPGILLGSLYRRMAGTVPTSADFDNTAKVMAAAPEKGAPVTEESLRSQAGVKTVSESDAAAISGNLRATYEKTGIDPFSVAQEAAKNDALRQELAKPGAGVPNTIAAMLEPKEPLGDATKAEATPAPAAEGTPAEPPPSKPLLDMAGQTADEARNGVPKGETDVNMGINPAKGVQAYAENYTPYVGLGKPFEGKPAGGLVDSLQKVLAPAARGPIASLQAGIMRANFGEMAHERELALEKMKGFAADFDAKPVADSFKFINAMEGGEKMETPRLQAAADGVRELLDQKREQVQALGKGQLENFIQNYFPHIWKDENAAQSFFGRRPLTGSGAFLKERTFDTFQQGIDAGLKPITTNPVELALLKAREMDKYIYGQKIFEEMKGADLARFVRFGDDAPPGWVKIDDKVARVFQHSEADKGMILRGQYYAPDEAATLINNHLSPGLQGNGAFNAWRGIGMAMNSAQLGLSAFHVGFTALDAMVSRVALGVKQLARGDILEGAGSVASGVAPSQPFLNIYKGDRLLRAYLGNLNDPTMAPIVDAIIDAGGRVKMDDFYRNMSVNAFKNAIRTKDYLGAGKAFLPTVLDRVNAPIFEQLVPRQKLGVYFDMAKDWLANNPTASVTTRRAELGKMWDSVDNRMGQLVYDNVFWNRVLKDGLMASVRSVGWNLGTFRELGGGIKDIKQTALGGPLTDRTAYVVALPLVTAIYGALTGYLYTGKPPEELKDYFFPKTGRIRPDGSEDRVSLPTYMKDVYAYGQDVTNFTKYGSNPLQTIENKAHPLISTVSQMLNNADFFGATIRNPSAPAVKQVREEAEYLLKQIEPFSLRNYQQQEQLKGETPTVGRYLNPITNPSMVGITPSPAYITQSPEQQESGHVSGVRDGLIKKFRQDLKAGADRDDIVEEMRKAGFSKQDMIFTLRSSSDTQKPKRIKSFGKDE